jgi:predicted regulator of Ras-like GTPase activity (Roadblock/LC7/MglB family)
MGRQDLVTEMRDLRGRVPGVTGALVAAFDGQLMESQPALDRIHAILAGPRNGEQAG